MLTRHECGMSGLDHRWDELPLLVQEALTAGGTGIGNPRGLALLAEEVEDAQVVVNQLKEKIPNLKTEGLRDQVWSLVEAAGSAVGARKRWSRALTPKAQLVEPSEHEENIKATSSSTSSALEVLRDVICTKRHGGDHQAWATKRQRRLAAHGGDPLQRTKIEKEERLRWIKVLAFHLQEGDALRYREARRTLDPEASMLHSAGGARARTLRRRLRAWARLRDWLLGVRGLVWPSGPADVVDYLEDLLRGRCARTVPDTVLGALAFMEEEGGVKDEDRCSTTSTLSSMVRDMNVTLAAGAPPTSKAPELHVVACIAMEFYVVDVSQKLYARVHAWTILVRLWASLRSDDLMGVSPQNARFLGSGLGRSTARRLLARDGRSGGSAPSFRRGPTLGPTRLGFASVLICSKPNRLFGVGIFFSPCPRRTSRAP